MSRDLQQRKRDALQARARRDHRERIAARFFGGNDQLFRWAAPSMQSVADRQRSPAWRRWLASWQAVRETAAAFQDDGELLLTFGSDPQVGPLVVSGATVTSYLEDWVREDADLLRVIDCDGEWDVSLDVHDLMHPRIALMVRGRHIAELAADRPGTEPWRWDFLPLYMESAVQLIKGVILEPGGSERIPPGVVDELASWGIPEISWVPTGPNGLPVLTVTVEPTREAQKHFDSLRRALLLEVPGLVVTRR